LRFSPFMPFRRIRNLRAFNTLSSSIATPVRFCRPEIQPALSFGIQVILGLQPQVPRLITPH
jgi:hypothetical protein